MSTRELAYNKLKELDEEQLGILIIFMDQLQKGHKPKPKKSAASLCGIFHDAANPDLIPLEKNAWAEAAVEEEKRFLEEWRNENS